MRPAAERAGERDPASSSRACHRAYAFGCAGYFAGPTENQVPLSGRTLRFDQSHTPFGKMSLSRPHSAAVIRQPLFSGWME